MAHKPLNPGTALQAVVDAIQHPADLRFMTKEQMAATARRVLEEYGGVLHTEYLQRLAAHYEQERGGAPAPVPHWQDGA